MEKFNHIIQQHLSFVPKHQQDWNELILFFLLAYMTIIHKTTGNTSSTMVYGRELRLPYDLLFGRPEQSEGVCNYVPSLHERLEKVLKFARSSVQLATEWMKNWYWCEAYGKEVQRRVNSYGFSACAERQDPCWNSTGIRRLYKVTRKINDMVYHVQYKVVHISGLAPYQGILDK